MYGLTHISLHPRQRRRTYLEFRNLGTPLGLTTKLARALQIASHEMRIRSPSVVRSKTPAVQDVK